MYYIHYDANTGKVIRAYEEKHFRPLSIPKEKLPKNYKPLTPPKPYVTVDRDVWVEANQPYKLGVVENGVFVIKDNYTYADYQIVMENHIKETRCARGYTTREPDVYKDCGVERWRQDALDFIAFRDEVLLYGLDVLNAYIAKKPIPSLEDFKKGLPKIKWTIE